MNKSKLWNKIGKKFENKNPIDYRFTMRKKNKAKEEKNE